MKEFQLSVEAQREQVALAASTERMCAERLQLIKYNEKLEALVRRKEAALRRQQEFLAEIKAERQAIKDEFQKIQNEMKQLP